MEAVASLFGRITAMKRRRPLHHTERDAEASLGAHVRVIMRALKERLDCLGEGPLQASNRKQDKTFRCSIFCCWLTAMKGKSFCRRVNLSFCVLLTLVIAVAGLTAVVCGVGGDNRHSPTRFTSLL